MSTTLASTAIQPMTDEAQAAGAHRLMSAIRNIDRAEHLNGRQLARYVLQIASTKKRWSLSYAVLDAAAHRLAPEIFDEK